MDEEFRQQVIDALRRGEDLPREWARALFPPERREYELVYHDKERVEDIIGDTMAVPLQPVTTFGSNGKNGSDGWRNMLIFGDNLQVVKTLLEQKRQGTLRNADGTAGVRLIYIDPPFATKQEFSGSKDQKAYQDKVAGAEFVEFLRRRLVLMHELLSDDGTLYVHLDTRKSHYMKVILDEIFGEHRFMNEVIWRRSTAHASAEKYGAVHDTILIYTKSSDKIWNPPLAAMDQEYIDKYFRYDDGDGKKYWLEDATGAGEGPARRFGTQTISPPPGRHFRWTQDKIDTFWEQKRFYITPNGRVQFKRYLEGHAGKAVGDVWDDIKRINQVAAERVQYPTQKPEQLLERVVEASSDEGDIVLDAFAGSGTTLAVAEKLKRRWIGVDGGKLAIYTIQKRMLSLHAHIGNKGPKLKAKPFTLYNAGLYDFSTLRKLPWTDWRFFALGLFGCKDEPHKIGGLALDGKLKGAPVLVFNHLENPDRRIDEETIQSIHAIVGNKIGRRFFVIAPRGVFDFQQDYVELDGIRYYALRIPYSVISELHSREFTALQQPNDERAINDLMESVGFHFIQAPVVEWSSGIKKRKGALFPEASLKIKQFRSHARLKGEDTHGGLESLSMLMIDYNYNGEVFEQDAVYFAHQLEEDDWTAWFPYEGLGETAMAVFIDIHGNEARVTIPRTKFGEARP